MIVTLTFDTERAYRSSQTPIIARDLLGRTQHAFEHGLASLIDHALTGDRKIATLVIGSPRPSGGA